MEKKKFARKRKVPVRTLAYQGEPLEHKGSLEKGGFATVEKYETKGVKKPKQAVAVKKLSPFKCDDLSPELLRELYVQSRLHHSNMEPLLDVFFQPLENKRFLPQLVLPLEEGSLAKFFSQVKDLSEGQLLSLLAQLRAPSQIRRYLKWLES